ncbi:unknown [Bacteroides sp. CAG:702]|nr:unknown [Bacteroides sp. CAG:702]
MRIFADANSMFNLLKENRMKKLLFSANAIGLVTPTNLSGCPTKWTK